MKNTFLLGFILSSVLGFSQIKTDSTQKKIWGFVKFYPLQLTVGEVRISYEQPIIRHLSLEISPGYLFGIVLGETDGDIGGPEAKNSVSTDYKGFAVRGNLKFYTSCKKDHAGFYFSPLLLYKSAHSSWRSEFYPYSLKATTEDVRMWSTQFLIGYKNQRKIGISYEPYFGLGIKHVHYYIDYHNPSLPDNFWSRRFEFMTIQIGIAIGYACGRK